MEKDKNYSKQIDQLRGRGCSQQMEALPFKAESEKLIGNKCPKFGRKMKEAEYRYLRYKKCGFKNDRYVTAIDNLTTFDIRKLNNGKSSLILSIASSMKYINSNRERNPRSFRAGRKSDERQSN
ncbi:hypothetical protein [Acidianus sp. RZ1]|uniref:hypothetical protein n=1 Tax=Acidianus sp. RZ1 TaxID=1540082 RepID=UPI001C123B30|nr:hypothetical protein [Acidianus sp. RZ1]